jgi:HTH-type transcriptional regulator / antitoxin HigA
MTPHIATHPGEVLKDELKARNIKQNEFSINTGIPKTILNELIKGKRNFTAETALILEKALDLPAKFWMDFQVQYDLDLARIKERAKEKSFLMEIWQQIAEFISYPILKKENLLGNSLSLNIEASKQIFGFETIKDLQNNVQSNFEKTHYKKSEKLQVDLKNLYTWEKLSQYKIKNQEVASYVEVNEGLISELKKAIFLNDKLLDKVQQILNNAGIKFLICPKFDKTPVDGISFWSGDNPAIVLTLRKSNIDNFAFTLFHELGHIKFHISENHSESFIDIDKATVETDKENEANSFATENLIPSMLWSEISSDLYTDIEIISYANQHQIHPYIIFGRKCWEMQRYNIFTSIDKTIR